MAETQRIAGPDLSGLDALVVEDDEIAAELTEAKIPSWSSPATPARR